MPTPLDRLTVRDGRIADTKGRQVILRGFVHITDDHRGPVELTVSNYDQIASWGLTAQTIRLAGSRLGVPNGDRDPSYLDKLDRWTTWAAERGVYTMFKMTTYDVPTMVGEGGEQMGRDLDRHMRAAFNPDFWQAFWDRDDLRQNRIDAWRTIWERFAGRPEVVGYDLVNEPFPGRKGPEVVRDYLFPFYEEATRALRKLDSEALVLLQPGLRVASKPQGDQGLPELENFGTSQRTTRQFEESRTKQPRFSDPLCAYEPHFFPGMGFERKPADYDRVLEVFQREAAQIGGILFIGEYGLPCTSVARTGGQLRGFNIGDARETARVFDREAISCTRIHYADEGWWAVCGPGFEETEQVESVVRPYVHRVAGDASWSFDFDHMRFAISVDIDPNIDAATELIVQLERFYPKGPVIEIDGAQTDHQVDRDKLVLPLAPGGHEIVLTPRLERP